MRGNPAKFFREGAALVAKALREPQGEKPMSDNPAKFSRGDTAFIMTCDWGGRACECQVDSREYLRA